MQYLVITKSQGTVIAEEIVEAPDALTAINQVEARLGEPVRVEYVSIEFEDERKRQMMVVHNWHGYSFHARRLPP